LKYGVIVCRETDNIGDDIQSYAAACRLPRTDYYIEREHMDVFRPEETEPVSAIINGWLMNNKLGWPLSEWIRPLYISMHFLEEDSMLIGDDFLHGLGGDGLRRHGPVGARDENTLRMLERNGIPAYFSGCMTLTLPKGEPMPPERPYICLTDVPEGVAESVRQQYPALDVKIIEHEPIHQPPLVDRKADWPSRFGAVKKLLDTYQNAAAVVTTRLHCAMPCLALETPVLLLDDNRFCEPSRMDGLSRLVHSSTTADFLSGHCSFQLDAPPANPEAYLPIRQALIRRTEDFVANGDRLPSPDPAAYDRDWEARALWKNEILLALAGRHNDQWNRNHKALEALEEGRKWLENQNRQLTARTEELQNWAVQQDEANRWLKEQLENVQKENSALAQGRKELQDWCRQLEEGKRWLEEQNAALSRDAQELRSWCGQPEEAKTWLEEQVQNARQEADRLNRELLSLQEELAEAKNKLAKTTYERNRLEADYMAVPGFIRKMTKKS